MTLSLTKSEVFNYWLEKSPDLLLAMRLLEKKETWVNCKDEDLVGLSSLLSQMSISDLFDTEEGLVFIAATMSFSQSMKLITYLESRSPGLLTNLLMLSKESEFSSAAKIFIARLQFLKDYGSFTDVFSSNSSKWVRNLLDNNTAYSDVKEVQLLSLLSQYESIIKQDKNLFELKCGSEKISEILEPFKINQNPEVKEINNQNVKDDFPIVLFTNIDEENKFNDVGINELIEVNPEEYEGLTKEELTVIVEEFKKTFLNEDELNASEDYQNFLAVMDELTQEVDSQKFPTSSTLFVEDQSYVFFNLPMNFILLFSSVEDMTVLELRVPIIKEINREINKIKADIKTSSIKFPETIINLIKFNQFKHHVTEEGLQGVIEAYKIVATGEVSKKDNEEITKDLPNELVEESPEIVVSPAKEEVLEETHINVELFSAKDIINFKAEHQNSKSDMIEKFIQKKIGLTKVRHKTLAKCDNLFKDIDTLYQNFPHFAEVIEYLEDYCHLQNSGNGVFYVPPTLLIGGAGVGKTFFTHDLSKLVSTHFELISMESMTAAWVMVGSSSSWNSASPGKIFNTLVDKEYLNPIFVLDEIDKCMTGNYPPENTLLPLLEQFTAKNFKDECIPLKIDASNIIWFATANEEKSISIPLKNRFNMFNVPEPNKEQQKALISNIYRKILSNNSWGHNFDDNLSDNSIDYLANQMTSGARDLRKFITTACAKATRSNRKDIRPEDFNIVKNPRAMGF